MALVGCLLAILGEALAETDEVIAGSEKARQGVAIAAQGEDIAMAGWSQICLLRILFSEGNFDEAEYVVSNLEVLSHQSHLPWFIVGLSQAWKARLILSRDNLPASKQWVEAHSLDISAPITQLNEGLYLVLARILFAQGKLEETQTLLHRLFEEAESSGRVSRLIEILILQALVLAAKKEQEQALAVLEHAVELAEVGGYVRIFVDEGPRLAHLLYQVANRKNAPAYAHRLLAAFPIPNDNETANQQAPPALIDQLSERELEVLQLVADGLSRQEIATRLVISLNTVKTHTRNIFSKLGVHSQLQAVRKAQG